ncbi:SurA N-terminal domain-containing protein [Marinomonas mediterranea]|jgi:Parvulin-like peptidyl-prolyl isomerase|uniref:Periplasmic chaperone PpiD n=1 Tax=Marinomonas mediterranea (strain ATCC 700492 / JCM 21426 / NBRC 103028 / MMB-1) TaxID=717774 RepID=F2JWP1_MARM1|nr:SurA N-terminal domain-containing protein [Marinomonas mediterranea]ADZ91805.1 PpiC-type peptidyl-prolyl cis-trans isomerase [Marinomonas mediterranea MMB-1]WCN17898.1 peptidylprolyl isomerase [Marinomonas mediterranea MMB-1]
MLQDIRDRSQSLIVKIIIGFIVVTFALFGVDALVTSFNSSETVAEVDGKEITRTQVLQTADTQRRQLISMMGNNIDPSLLDENLLQRRALDSLIELAVLKNQADGLELGVSDAQIDSLLVSAEQYQTDGVFDQNKYLNAIRSLGFTPLAYKERIKESYVLSQLRSAVTESEFALPSQVNAISELQNQKRTYEYVQFSLADQTEQTDVTDGELQAYYDDHQQDFVSPEQVKISYVVVTTDALATNVKVTDQELQNAYQTEIAGLDTEERDASHILIDTSIRSEDEAKSIIAEIQSKLASGDSFASLAKEYSDDPGSKDVGGELGFVAKGALGESFESFEDALFAMNVGDIQEAETQYGLHLIKLNAIDKADAPTLEELRDQLTADITARKAKDALLDAQENIADLAYASDELAPLADEYGLDVETSDYFGQSGGNDVITSEPTVISAAFSDSVKQDGQNSDPIELGDDKIVVIHVDDHKAESPLSFEDAKTEIASTLIKEKAESIISEKAAELFADASQDSGWEKVELAPRGQDEVTSLVFSMPHPVEGTVQTAVKSLVNGDVVALKLLDVVAGESDSDSTRTDAYTRFVTQNQAQLNSASHLELVKDLAEIEQ